jgi:hypothetical protein
VSSERRKEFEAYLASIAAQHANIVEETKVKVDETRGELWRNEERQFLLEEAGFMARSFFRACLRSIKLMRPGNEHDEKEFREREEKQFSRLDDENTDMMFSMQPPVNRENELKSRASYYHAHLREHINSDSQCLNSEPWREQDIEVFLHFLRTGEKRRRYVLKDYRFDDPYKSLFDNERIKRFEERANALLRDTYKANGWTLRSDFKPRDPSERVDSIFGFIEDPEEKDQYY